MFRPHRFVTAFRRWLANADPTAVAPEVALDARRLNRDRRATASTLAAVLGRSVGLVASFITIPLALGYLGAERYGILAALTSISAMLIFADMGLGNGLLNVVSGAYGRDDREQARTATSSAFVMLVAISAVFLLVLAVAYPFIDWAGIFNIASESAAREAGPAAAIVIGVFIVSVPFGMVERLRMAYQEGFYSSIAAATGALLAVAALIGAVAIEASLPVLLLLLTGAPVLATLANGILLFRIQRPWLTPSLTEARRDVALSLARIGLLFLVLQAAVAIAFQSDVVVAAMVLGPEEAATYAITMKFFLLAPTFVGFYLTALWPAYGEAIARGDIIWIRRTLRRSVVIAALVSTASAVVLVAVGPWLISAWTGDVIRPPFGLLVGAAAWSVLLATFTAIAMLFNAASVVVFQVVTASVMALTSIAASIWLAGTLGVSGIVIGTLGAYAVCSAVPILVYLPRVLRRLEAHPVDVRHA